MYRRGGGTVGGLMMSACWDTFGAKIVYLLAAVLCGLGWFAASLSYRWLAQPRGTVPASR